MTKQSLRIAVSIALVAALLTVFLWNVDLAEVGRSLAEARPGWLALATLLALSTYWLRAVRWQIILRPVGPLRHSSVVLATGAGYAAMSLLPARLGDLVRPLLLAQREHKPASATIASIVTERILDLGTVVFFFLIFALWPPVMDGLDEQARRYLEALTRAAYLLAAGLVVATVALLGLLGFQERLVRLLTAPVARVAKRWEQPVASFLNHFLDGIRVLRRPRDLVVTVGASLLLWYVIYWQVATSMLAFSIDLPFRTTYCLVMLAVVGLAIPTPGGIGGFHKATQAGLVYFFAIELNRATGFAIAYHAICFVPITVIGLACLPAFGLSLRDVSSMKAAPAQETAARDGNGQPEPE